MKQPNVDEPQGAKHVNASSIVDEPQGANVDETTKCR
jgi:hypothetical protein